MNSNRRALQPPGGECHDVFGSEDSPILVPHHRITKPPGGESSDIFGASPISTPPTTPRKVKNYMASTIFTPENGQQVKTRQRPNNDSFNRLFGAKDGDVADGQLTPRGKDHQKSNVIFADAGKAGGLVEVVAVANGINGDSIGHENGINGHSPTPINGINGISGFSTNGINGHSNGINGHPPTNGHYNGNGGSTGSISGPSSGSSTPNGSINGDYKPNGHTNGMPTTPSRRIPPGGYSTKLW